MDIATTQAFFMWCTILNGGLLVLTSGVCIFISDVSYRINSTWAPMPRESFNVILLSLVAFLKIIWLVFNVVPFLALLIIG